MTDDVTSIWLDSVDRVAEGAYRPIAGRDALPAQVRADSALWADRFLSSAANPHLRGWDVAWSYHLATKDTPDLIRAVYDIPGHGLDVIESRAYLITRIHEPAPATPQEVATVAELLLAKPPDAAAWRFQFSTALTEGGRFTTNPSIGPLDIMDWPDRVDGGIRHGRLYFLQFKKIPDRQGYPDLRRWFDEAFRARR